MSPEVFFDSLSFDSLLFLTELRVRIMFFDRDGMVTVKEWNGVGMKYCDCQGMERCWNDGMVGMERLRHGIL